MLIDQLTAGCTSGGFVGCLLNQTLGSQNHESCRTRVSKLMQCAPLLVIFGVSMRHLVLALPSFPLLFYISFLSHPPAHTRLLLITITSHKFLITTLLVTVSTARPRFFPVLISVTCRLQRWTLSSSCGDPTPQREREREREERERRERERRGSKGPV